MSLSPSRAQTRALVSAGTSLFALSSAYRDLRKARRTGDVLAIVDGVVSLLAVLTGIAVAIRALNDGDDE